MAKALPSDPRQPPAPGEVVGHWLSHPLLAPKGWLREIGTADLEQAQDGGWAAAPIIMGGGQPLLKVEIHRYPESNGKTNWTALLLRQEPFKGLVGTGGGMVLASEPYYWNRAAYYAERCKFLLGMRDTEPFILDYGDDIKSPEEWKGETDRKARQAKKD